MDYAGARWYDPATGEFLSVDPDFNSTLDAYGYADENPLDGTDPSGLMLSTGRAGICKTVAACDASSKTTKTTSPTKNTTVTAAMTATPPPTAAQKTAAGTVGTDLGKAQVDAEQYIAAGAAATKAMQACDNDPNGPIPGRNNPCGAFGNDENLVRTDARNVRDDAASLASASCDLQKIVPGGQTCGDSSGLWVGLAIALSIVSGGVAVAGEGAVATVAGFVSITSGLAASIPDVSSCIDGGDQQACMNMAISLAQPPPWWCPGLFRRAYLGCG